MEPNPSNPPSLRDLQKWMRWIITDPRGVADALSDPAPEVSHFRSRYTRPKVDCFTSILETPELSSSERLDIYAEGYFSRIVESMSSDFSTIKRVIGETAFLKLIADYLKAHPSIYPNMGEVGGHLPEFLSEYELTREVECLPDLAKLEWLAIESFYADDVPPFDINSFREVPESAWPRVVFSLDPSVRLLQTRWQVGELWKKRNSEEFDSIFEQAEPGEASFCLHRVQGEVHVSDLSIFEFLALSLMAQGMCLGEICIKLDEASRLSRGELVSSPPPVMQWFGEWVRNGLICGIDFRGSQ